VDDELFNFLCMCLVFPGAFVCLVSLRSDSWYPVGIVASVAGWLAFLTGNIVKHQWIWAAVAVKCTAMWVHEWFRSRRAKADLRFTETKPEETG
jgi:hypothetical protein